MRMKEKRQAERIAALEAAGAELTAALWALVIAHEPSMRDGLSAALKHGEEVVKRYSSEKTRNELTKSLELAKAGVGDRRVEA